MLNYFIKRALGVIPTLLIVAVLVFLFVHLLPGDPARLAAGPEADEMTVDLVRKDLGLDNKDVLDAAEKLSIAAKSHSSSISEAEAGKIRGLLKQNGAPAAAAKPPATTRAITQPGRLAISGLAKTIISLSTVTISFPFHRSCLKDSLVSL